MIGGWKQILTENLDAMDDEQYAELMKDPEQRRMAKMIEYERKNQ